MKELDDKVQDDESCSKEDKKIKTTKENKEVYTTKSIT